MGLTLAAAVVTAGAYSASGSIAQPEMTPTNDAPNPYTTVENHFKMPAGRTWGATSAVDIDRDGKSIWVAERCGANTCWDAKAGATSPLDTVLKFDANGNLVTSFGAGLMIFPHGIHVDRDGNIWVTDGQDNMPRRAPGAAPDSPLPPPPAKVIGHQVFKFSPEGKILMTLGKPGGNQPGQPADPSSFYQPNDVITYPNGDILVAEGHNSSPSGHARLSKFDRQGKLLMEFGKKGSGRDGEFDQPHGLAFDSKGRLFVADRSNNRILILDAQSFKTLDVWHQFSRNSGIWIDRNDVLYAADSESGSVNPAHGAWKRGIRIGSVKDGKVTAFIPDPSTANKGTLAAEGVAVDAAGNIYGAEVGPRALKKYVKK
jgi:DNA-binding beta-propeller fold protein YncE